MHLHVLYMILCLFIYGLYSAKGAYLGARKTILHHARKEELVQGKWFKVKPLDPNLSAHTIAFKALGYGTIIACMFYVLCSMFYHLFFFFFVVLCMFLGMG